MKQEDMSMGETKTLHKIYAAWEYEKEIEDLNEQSRQGWQLVKGGCFYSKYKKNNTIVKRYQIDFNTKIEDKKRYIDMFQEQGWTYINSTFNGWHYFEKIYDPSLAEEVYQIYTDRPSKTEMANRWIKIMRPLLILVAIGTIFYLYEFVHQPDIAGIGLLVEFICVLYLAVRGIFDMKKVIWGERSTDKKKLPIGAIFAVVILGFLWYIFFSIIM